MIEKAAEGVYRIFVPLPHNPLKNLNSYFIAGRGRNLLIDTGFRLPECLDAMREGLSELGADMSRTDIFLTHMHTDHCGLAPTLASPGSEIFISAVDGAILEAPDMPARWREFDGMYIAEGFPEEALRQSRSDNPLRRLGPEPYSDYRYLEDGDVLRYGGRKLVCVLTPGHTPGHMCLYDEENKLMFLGDHILFDITPNITRNYHVEDSLGDYLRNLEKIKAYDIAVPLPAHRTVSATVRERAEELEEHHRERMEEIVSIIRENPGMTAYDIAGRMKWSIRARNWDSFPLQQKWFAMGEAMAHLDRLRLDGRVFREPNGGKYVYTSC